MFSRINILKGYIKIALTVMALIKKKKKQTQGLHTLKSAEFIFTRTKYNLKICCIFSFLRFILDSEMLK